MGVVVLNIEDFRKDFPAFDDEGRYDNARLQAYFSAASSYVSPEDYGSLTGTSRTRAVYLMMAHLMDYAAQAADGGSAPQQVTSSSIDKVSVTVQPAPAKSQWQYWLSLTPYGMELWALLSQAAAGGFYIGGFPERSAIRKVGGIF